MLCYERIVSETMVVTAYYKSHSIPIFGEPGKITGEKPAITDETRLIRSWHDKTGQPQERTYPEDALELVPPSPARTWQD